VSAPAIGPDLALIGYELVASAEACRCSVCAALDLRYDVDAIAARPDERPLFIAYRAQPVYDYRTITVRWANDRGNEDVQLAKLLSLRSRADLYVQGYPSGVAYATADDLRTGFTTGRTKVCSGHRAWLRGDDGQKLVVACPDCAGVVYVKRDEGDPFKDLVW